MPRYYETQDGITIDIAEVLEQYRDEIKKTADKNPDNKSLQAQVAGINKTIENVKREKK